MAFKFNPFTGTLDVVNSGSSGSGDVVGPASSEDGQVSLFDGVTGKLLKAAGVKESGSALVPLTDGSYNLGTDTGPLRFNQLFLSEGFNSGIQIGGATDFKLYFDSFGGGQTALWSNQLDTRSGDGGTAFSSINSTGLTVSVPIKMSGASILSFTDGGSDIGASGATRFDKIRAKTSFIIGPNADASAPSITTVSGSADQTKYAAIAHKFFTDSNTVPKVVIDATSMYPGSTTNTVDLGIESFKWNDIRFGGLLYVGTNADATAPYITTGAGGANRLKFVAPGSQIEFNANSSEIAVFYDDGTFSTVQLTRGFVIGMTDNTIDIGAFTGPGPLRQRPKDSYLGSHIYLGGTAGGSDTSTSKLYFGSQNTATTYVASDTTRLGNIETTLDFKVINAGFGIKITEGTDGMSGTTTLVAGTVTVTNANVTGSTRVHCTVTDINGGVQGFLECKPTAGSFTITSSNIADTSIISYLLINQP